MIHSQYISIIIPGNKLNYDNLLWELRSTRLVLTNFLWYYKTFFSLNWSSFSINNNVITILFYLCKSLIKHIKYIILIIKCVFFPQVEAIWHNATQISYNEHYVSLKQTTANKHEQWYYAEIGSIFRCDQNFSTNYTTNCTSYSNDNIIPNF